MSLIARFLTLTFHSVVWRHVPAVVGFVVTVLLQIYRGSERVLKIGEDLTELNHENGGVCVVCGAQRNAHMLERVRE